jgi:group I intron endonuclease
MSSNVELCSVDDDREYKIYAILLQDDDLYVIDNDDGTYDFHVPDGRKRLYFGLTKQEFSQRMKTHNTHSKDITYSFSLKLYNCLRKYGFENFTKIVLQDGLTFEEADVAERYWIAKYDSFHNGLNSTEGGAGSNGISGDEHYKAKPIKIYNNSTKEILEFNWLMGVAEYLDVPRENIGQVLSGRNRQVFSKKYNAWFQAKYSDDLTDWDCDMKTKSEKRKKPIIFYDIVSRETFKFPGGVDAASHFGIDESGIFKVIRGKTNQIHARGRRFDVQYDPPTREWRNPKSKYPSNPVNKS